MINTGFDTATEVVLNDVLASGLTFVSGSLSVTTGANAGAKTDATADDQGEYIAASRTVRVRLGTGANTTVGGTLAKSASTTVVFRVRPDGTVLGQIANQATVTAAGQFGSAAQDYLSDSDAGQAGAQATTVFVEQCTQSSDCSGATPLCLTSVSPRRCVGCLSNANCGGTTPICDLATNSCRSCGADAECPGTAPVCQTSGACGACSATKPGLCGGATPICDTSNATCVAVPGEQPLRRRRAGVQHGDQGVRRLPGQLGLRRVDAGVRSGAADVPGLRRRRRVRRVDARVPAERARVASVRPSNSLACGGATPVCFAPTGTCVRCVANADCGGHDAGVRRRHAPVPRVRRRRRVRRRDAGVPGERRVRAVLGDQRQRVRRRDAGLLHGERHVRAAASPTRSAAGRRRCATRRRTPAAPAPATATAAASTPACQASGACGQCSATQRQRVLGRDAGLLRGRRRPACRV